MATNQISVQPAGLAACLVRSKLITQQQFESAYAEATKEQKTLVQYLVEAKILDGRSIAVAAADEFGVPLIDIEAVDLTGVGEYIDEKLLRKHRALPFFKRGNRLYVAISDPANSVALDEIRFNTGSTTEAVVVEEEKLSAAIDRVVQTSTANMPDFDDADLDELETVDDKKSDIDDSNVDEAPIVRYVNKLLTDAITAGASDIHFEPYEKYCRVRYRQDGMLFEKTQPPLNLASRMVARLKVMSRMNIAERRIPQDGRIKLKLSRDRDIDFRVNTLPTLYGEKVVLRALESGANLIPLEKLGLEPEQKANFLNAIHKPYGLILVTGPTGSGKTVSLYTALNILNKQEVNISTVEDPVEIRVPGINQCSMNPAAGLTFAAALRSFLRQDPDIIMVGEIRDLETAEIAVKAAQTGHLVLSTLHTNDAPQTLTRLMNMGVPTFNIASSVHLIMAQRLARRLCKFCKMPEEIPPEALRQEGFAQEDIDEGITVYKGVGCDRCNKGYKGRVGIYQVMPISEETGLIIMEGGNAIQLAEQAKREGIADLRESGLRKVKQGLISLEELNRVTKD